MIVACASCAKQEAVVSETTVPIYVEEAKYETMPVTSETTTETTIEEEEPYEEIDYSSADIAISSMYSDGIQLDVETMGEGDEAVSVGTTVFNKGHIETGNLSLEKIMIAASTETAPYEGFYTLSGNNLDEATFTFSEVDVEPKEFPEDETVSNEVSEETFLGTAALIDFGDIYQCVKSEQLKDMKIKHNRSIVINENVGAFDMLVLFNDEETRGFGITGITEEADNISFEITEKGIVVSTTEGKMSNIVCHLGNENGYDEIEVEDTDCVTYNFETNEIEAVTLELIAYNVGQEG